MPDDRLRQLSQRLAEKQKELDALHAQLAGLRSTRGWRVLTAVSLTYRLLLLQPAAYHRVRAAIRRRLLRVRRVAGRYLSRLPGAGPAFGAVDPYVAWQAAHEADVAQLDAQRRTSAAWTDAPHISVVVPVFNPPADAFGDCIDSVRRQSYSNWQLVLVLAGAQLPSVVAAVQSRRDDERIVVVELPENLNIAGNTNAGIARATGDFVLFLDHDDMLSPAALYEAARLFRNDPLLDLVTFDEDKVAADGRTRLDPIFKPTRTSPEHLLSFNDRMHSVVRRTCLDRVGGVPIGVDGAQDWDLGLRLLEAGARARHVPRVLYHWRMVPGSAAGDALAKPWAFEAQRRALVGHLARVGRPEPQVEHPQLGVVRVSWRPSGRRVSIVIPTKDRANLLGQCLRSIRERTAYSNYEIIVIDTGSREEATADLYRRLGGDSAIRILQDESPFNFSRVNNAGARAATGEILLFMNNDIEAIDGDWLDELVRWVDLPDVGCVGPKLLYPNGTLQHAGIVTGLGGHGSHIYQGGPAEHTWGVFGSVDFYRNYLMLGGACLAIDRAVFERLGGFDETYSLCYSDLDLCLKAAEAGLRNVYTPFARLLHHEGGTRGRHFPPGDVERACVKMFPLVIQGDPFFNPNLSYRHLEPTIAPDDEPAARAELISHIAGLYGVSDAVTRRLHDEVVGRTALWRDYRTLLRSMLPPVPDRPASVGRFRVLCVSHDLSRSGAPIVLLHLTRALRQLGHAITVLAPKDGRLRPDLEEAGADVIISPLALEAPYAMVDVLRSFDAVVANTVLSWRVVLAAASVDTPTMWLIHESQFGLDFVRQRAGAIEALATADEIVFPSRQTLELFRADTTGNASAEVYGIGMPVLTAPAPVLDPARLHIVASGSLEPRKGQDVLLSAYRRLPPAVRNRTTLHVMGRALDAGFAEILAGLARGLSVEWHGEVSPADALSLVAASDALVCASRDETGPLVVMEAMAFGRAIVSTPVGAVPELLEDEGSALLVPVDDDRALAKALTRILEDPDLRTKLGAAARENFAVRLTRERYGLRMAERLARAVGGRLDRRTTVAP